MSAGGNISNGTSASSGKRRGRTRKRKNMSKRMLKDVATGKPFVKNKGVGKVYGRRRGSLIFSEALNRMTTIKMVEAIENNKR